MGNGLDVDNRSANIEQRSPGLDSVLIQNETEIGIDRLLNIDYTRGKLEGVQPKFKLKSVYTNSRSLCNKMDEFEQMLAEEAIDFVSVTETWFNLDYELNIPGYVGFYSSRKLCKGGDVAVYIDKKMLCQTELIYSNSDNGFDVVIVKLFFTSKHMYSGLLPPTKSFPRKYINLV